MRLPTSLRSNSLVNRQGFDCLTPMRHLGLHPSQRINQFSGIRGVLWKKDAHCDVVRSLSAAVGGNKSEGNEAADIMHTFPCWVVPRDNVLLQSWRKMSTEGKFVFKPVDRGEGRGIVVGPSLREAQGSLRVASEKFVAQPLMANPYLINGFKFDLRCYVLVTSASPLRAYYYNDGLVRFASEPYVFDKLSKKQFLTNTYVGRMTSTRSLSNLTWSFGRLHQFLSSRGVEGDKIFTRIRKAAVATFLAAEARIRDNFAKRLKGSQCTSCFQLFGVDVILDENLSPFVIEVNGLPSMALEKVDGHTEYNSNYTMMKMSLTRDVVRLVFKQDSHVAPTLFGQMTKALIGGPHQCGPQHHECVNNEDLGECRCACYSPHPPVVSIH